MNHVEGDPGSAASRALEREMALVESAIEMVASGRASRMHLGGLSFGDALLGPARQIGATRLVRVVPRWGVGEEGLALDFEPLNEVIGSADG